MNESLTRYWVSERVRLTSDQRVLDVTSTDSVSTKQNQSLAHKRRQVNHFLISDQIELIKDRIVLGQVLVLVGFSSSTEYAAIGYDVAFFGVLNGQIGRAPLLQLGTWYETGKWTVCGHLRTQIGATLVSYSHSGTRRALGLPPIVVVFARYLKYVADLKVQAGLRTWYEIVMCRIVVEQAFHVNLFE